MKTIILFILFIAVFPIFLFQEDKKHQLGISLYNGLRLREKPNIKSKVLKKLNQGQVFQIHSRTDGKYDDVTFNKGYLGFYWYNITLPTRGKGWVYGKYISQHLLYSTDDIFANEKIIISYNYLDEKFVNYFIYDSNKRIRLIKLSHDYCEPIDYENSLIFRHHQFLDDQAPEIFLLQNCLHDGRESYDYRFIILKVEKDDIKIMFEDVLQSSGFAELSKFNQFEIFKNKKMILKHEFTCDLYVEASQEYYIYKYEWDSVKQQFISKSKEKKKIYLRPKANGLRFRESPDLKSKIIRKLNKNDLLTIAETNPDLDQFQKEEKWIYVRLKNGAKGWVSFNYLEYTNKFIKDISKNRYHDNKMKFKDFFKYIKAN